MKQNSRSELIRLRQELSVLDIVFCLDLDGLQPCLDHLGTEERLHKALTNRRRLDSASDFGLHLWQRQLAQLKKQPGFLQEYFAPCSHWSAAGDRKDLLCGTHSLLLPLPMARGLAGRFILMTETREQWLKVQANLESITGRLQLWLMQHALSQADRLNPLLDYRIISGVSHMVLRRLAHGIPRAEIAREMRLTPRGVDYHISTLKELLNAKNTPHLVFVGNATRLI